MTTERKFAGTSFYWTAPDGTGVNADLQVVLVSHDGVDWEIEQILGMVPWKDGKPLPMDTKGFEVQVVESISSDNSALVQENNKLRKKNEKLKNQVGSLEAELGRIHATLANALLEESLYGKGHSSSSSTSGVQGCQ